MFVTRFLLAIALLSLSMVASGAASRDTPNPGPGEGTVAGNAFWTKYAYFAPSRFSDLPDWERDNLTDAWAAFTQSCSVLRTKSAWANACARAGGVNGRDSDDIRRFMEREFALYEIRERDTRTPMGVITGYYEPLLNGSFRYGDRYTVPVYGVPDDLLYLDVHELPRAREGTAVLGRIDGRSVIPCGTARCAGGYEIAVAGASPDVRDKRLRVRVEGNRIVPYYTRSDIERGMLRLRDVIMWVDDASALYSMQIQGSGKIRTPDGQIIRLAYAEQNGHPFQPPQRVRTRGLREETMLLRGIEVPKIAEADPARPLPQESASAPPASSGNANVDRAMQQIMTRGILLAIPGRESSTTEPSNPNATTRYYPEPAAGERPAPRPLPTLPPAPREDRTDGDRYARVTPPDRPAAAPVAPSAYDQPAPVRPPRPGVPAAPTIKPPPVQGGSSTLAAPTVPQANARADRPPVPPANPRADPPPVYADAGAAKGTRRDNRNCAEVQRLVDMFLKGTDRPERVRVPGDSVDCESDSITEGLRPSQPLPSATSSFGAADALVAQLLPARRYWFSSDPSFVFFRPIPNSDSGPIGALGVPLTAGRSVAVDPRTTPLGAPVFIATTGRSLGDRINRLMMAQDTGGAIRGAVRADYFWGFGPKAGQWASRMNETGRMWLLLPRDLKIAMSPAMQTRGIAPRGVEQGERECVIADPDLCVE